MITYTVQQVEAHGHNAALIANCPMPSAYRNTKWAPVWTAARDNAQIKFGIKGGASPSQGI